MIREKLRPPEKEKIHGFRVRGPEVSRVEGFSDAVFGFALTLLVVSLEVPRSVGDLFAAMRGFVGFAICFIFLYMLWNAHYIFFRKYGLEDGVIRALNATLLFMVLLFVYPLKFLFTMLTGAFMGTFPRESLPDSTQAPTLMLIYGLGYAAIEVMFGLMHARAWKLRSELELNEYERFATKMSIVDHGVMTGIALTSVLLAKILPPGQIQWAGWFYGVIGIWKGWQGSRLGDARRALAEPEKQ